MMSEERLTKMAKLSIENEIIKNINFEKIIEEFASIKSRNFKI